MLTDGKAISLIGETLRKDGTLDAFEEENGPILGRVMIVEVNRNVIGFSISNDCVSYYSNDVWDSEITYTQAILIDLGTDYLCIDKEAWFSEILFVKGGDKIEELVHDDSSSLEIDPEEDPNSRMEYSSEIVAL